jgi:hypothetical protein
VIAPPLHFLQLLFDIHPHLECNHPSGMDSKSRKKCHPPTQVSIEGRKRGMLFASVQWAVRRAV